jgi:PAS domain S-box-containing protein
MTESSGKIVLVNRAIECMFGYGRDELLGQGIDVLVPERLRGQHVAHRQSFVHGPEARQMGRGRELFGRRKDGSEFPVEVGLNPIDTREGTLVLGVVIDISERKRIEALKAEFVSTVSHELRTPLTSISASLALLAGATAIKLPEPAKRLVTIAHSNSARLVRLVNDILDVEKLESGKIVFDVKRTEVGALVGQAIEVNRAVADSRGVVIRLEASASHEVRTDPDRLMQVITNLLSNAIKFSPAAAEVNVGIERRGRWVRIAVVDHGQGIPEAFKPHIFEKFAQADASNARQMGGTGLGLSIVKEIVQRLGGQVGFSDTPGGGATFHVDLPIAESAAGLTVAAQRDARARCPVLLCEDDREVADKLQDRLLQAGFATDLALTAAEALASAESRAYSTILIDLLLPDADGITLIQQLRAQPQHAATPIIVVSADPAKGRGDLQSSNLNVLDWLSKPLDVSRLVRTIEPAIVRQSSPPLSVLHLDDDPEVLRIVANALNQNARVVSVASVDAGRVALEHRKIDLAILDLALDGRSGLDLLPDLHDRAGNAIPVIVYSARGANPACAAQVQAALTKSRDSIDSLIAILHSRVACAIEER